MKTTRALPRFSEWQTYGGHQTGRLSYHVPVPGGPVSVHGSPGTYMLDTVFSATGRYRGYRVLFCDAGGELISRGAQRGLYREVTGRPVTLPEARRAVAQDFAVHFWPRADVDFWHPELPEVSILHGARGAEVMSWRDGNRFVLVRARRLPFNVSPA